MCIEHDVLKSIDFNDVIDNFAACKSRKDNSNLPTMYSFLEHLLKLIMEWEPNDYHLRVLILCIQVSLNPLEPTHRSAGQKNVFFPIL